MKLLIPGEKLCFDISGRKSMFFKKISLSRFQELFEASFVKEDIVWFRVFDSTSENKRRNRITKEKNDSIQVCTRGLLRDSQMR